MLNNKKLSSNNLLIGLVFIIVAEILTIIIFSFNNKVEKIDEPVNLSPNDSKTQEKIILDANREAILEAENIEDLASQSFKIINKDDHILGSIDAPVQLIVYNDFECPFCAKFSDTLKIVIEEFKEDVVIVFRHFPLTAIHYNAMSAAIASECAAEQGNFWEMHDKIFENNKKRKLGIEQFKANAKALDLDETQFNKCLDTEKYKDEITLEMEQGEIAGVSGTPGNFINGIPYPGAYPFEDFSDSTGKERDGLKTIITDLLEK